MEWYGVHVTCPCGNQWQVSEPVTGEPIRCPACGRTVQFAPTDSEHVQADTYALADGPDTAAGRTAASESATGPQSTFVPIGPQEATDRDWPSGGEPGAPLSADSFAAACWMSFAYARQTLLHMAATLVSVLMIFALLSLPRLLPGLLWRLRYVMAVFTLIAYAAIGGYLIAHCLDIVRHSARGDDRPPNNPGWEANTILYGVKIGLALIVVYLGPAMILLLLYWLGVLPAWLVPAARALFALGAFSLPMGFIGASTDSFQRGLRHDLITATILSHFVDYLLLWLVLAVAGVPGVGLALVSISVPTGLLSLFLLVVILSALIVGGYVASRAMGLFARFHRDRLPFDFGE